MKNALLVSLILIAGAAHAQSTSTAMQSSASQSTAQGTIQFSQTPEHTSQTVRNVSAPILGAYAGSFSQLGCGSTTQGGVAFAGFSIAGGSSTGMQDCVSEVAANESMKQATADAEHAPQLKAAAIAIRCQVSEEVYKAYIAAGLDCLGLKPASMHSRTDDQPANYKVSGN